MKPTKHKSKTKSSALLFVIICTFFTAIAQLLWKLGSQNFNLTSISGFFDLMVVLGFISYGIGLIFLILALKKWELSVVYPFVSLSFIWVALLSVFFLKESMVFLHWFGIIFIVGGVALINLGSKK